MKAIMLNLQSIYQRMKHKLQHNEAKDRGPVPPVRAQKKHAAAQAQPTKKEPKPAVEKQQAPAEPSRPTIVSRGNNKNVFITVEAGQDADEALRLADHPGASESPSLETIEDGLDPYNSGVFSTKRVWRESR